MGGVSVMNSDLTVLSYQTTLDLHLSTTIKDVNIMSNNYYLDSK